MGIQKHNKSPNYQMEPIAYGHHNPNNETGPLTQIARDYAAGKVTEQADKAIDPAIESVKKYGASLFTTPSAAATTAAAPASIGTAMPAAITALGPAGAPGMLSAGLGGAAAGTTGALTGAAGGAAAGGAMAGAAPMLAALGPVGLAIGGGLLASQLMGGNKSHVQHLNEGRVQIPPGDRDAVEAARRAELERLRQAWLNRNNRGVTESLIPEAHPYQSAMPVTKDWGADQWSGTHGQTWDFPTERIDDVRFKGGPPDMIGPLAPNANEDAKAQLELAIKEGEHISEQLRKDKLNDAKIAKVESETNKGTAMNLSGYEKPPVTFTDEEGTVHYAHEPYDERTDELMGRINTILYPPIGEQPANTELLSDMQNPYLHPEMVSIIPEARPYDQQVPLGMGREAAEARHALGLNAGGPVGPLGRSQLRTPTAIAHAKAYDYYNKAASAKRDPFGMYFGKQMVRSFPGEAPLSIKERIVDPLKAKSPTLFGRINLGGEGMQLENPKLPTGIIPIPVGFQNPYLKGHDT